MTRALPEVEYSRAMSADGRCSLIGYDAGELRAIYADRAVHLTANARRDLETALEVIRDVLDRDEGMPWHKKKEAA